MKNFKTHSGSIVPQSFITKGKKRLKQYVDNVYLENGDEFEIEIFNPTQNKVLAKIELNGESIGSGIILRPGERVFLERFIDTPKKFKFETYSVDDNNQDVEKAIANNGDVMVSFYDEYKPYYFTGTTSITHTNIPNFIDNTKFINTCGNITYTTNNLGMLYTSNSLGTLTNGSSEIRSASLNNKLYKKRKETGRVEKGSHSSQQFTYDTTQFQLTKFASNWWKILPMSQKVKTIDEVNTIYCLDCGTKRKKDTYKFCPNCGKKYEEKKEPKIIFTDDVKYVYYVNGEYKVLVMSSYNDTLDKFLERHKDKSKIIIKRDSLTEDSLRAIVIE
jgi:hypothetical protein